MVATHPAILPVPLHYRHLERIKAHYFSHGVAFDDLVPLNEDIQSDLKWWIQEASSYNGQPLQITHWDLTIESDTSKQDRGPAAKGQTQGTMDSYRAIGTYTLFRNEGSLSGITIILYRKIISISTPSYGQCHKGCISE